MTVVQSSYNDSHTLPAERHRAEYDFRDGFLARSHDFADTFADAVLPKVIELLDDTAYRVFALKKATTVDVSWPRA